MQTTYREPSMRAVDEDINMRVITPVDRVRLPSIVAGILTTLATMVVLTVLGLAVGLSSYDGTGNILGLGAGIWGAISALLAFGLGGFVAARSAATASGPTNGVFNGGMMWAATIVLIIMLLGGGIGSLVGLAGNVATNVAAPIVGQTANQTTTGAAPAVPAGAANAVTNTIQNAQDALTPANRDQIAADASRAAWGVLLTLGLSAIASLIGGGIGAGADRRVIAQRQAATIPDNRSTER